MITAGQTYVEGDCRRCGDQLQIRETWSRAEVTTFLAIAASDRLCVVWRLSLHGLRRGEAPQPAPARYQSAGQDAHRHKARVLFLRGVKKARK
jgi:hypothetical protein